MTVQALFVSVNAFQRRLVGSVQTMTDLRLAATRDRVVPSLEAAETSEMLIAVTASCRGVWIPVAAWELEGVQSVGRIDGRTAAILIVGDQLAIHPDWTVPSLRMGSAVATLQMTDV